MRIPNPRGGYHPPMIEPCPCRGSTSANKEEERRGERGGWKIENRPEASKIFTPRFAPPFCNRVNVPLSGRVEMVERYEIYLYIIYKFIYKAYSFQGRCKITIFKFSNFGRVWKREFSGTM